MGDDAACLEQNDARSEQQGFAKVVGDEDDGFAEAAGEGAELALQVRRASRDRARRTARPSEESAGSAARARATPTRWRWPPESSRGRRFANSAGSRPTRCSSSSTRAAMRAASHFSSVGNEGDVFGDREMREEAGFLNDVSDAAAEPDGVPLGGGAVLDEDLPL